MMTKEELNNKLRSLNKYTDSEINDIVSKYESRYLNNSKSTRSSSPYDEVKSILGLDSLNEVRFYKIANLSAIVVRDVKNNTTSVSFSIYNRKDIASKLNELMTIDVKKCDKLNSENSSSLLHQITVGKNYDSCKHAAINYRDNKYTVKLDGIRISELAIYESWIKLAKSNAFPKYVRDLNLDVRVISLLK